MSSRDVVDPAGVTWTVRHRWYPWRRALSFREAMASEPTVEEDPDEEADEETDDDSNVIVQILLVILAVVAWVVWSIGRVLFYTGAIVLFVVFSLAELALQLAVLPVAMLLRVLGVLRWPVQINRAGKHVQTRYAGGYGAASTVCDEVAVEIERGALPVPETAPAA